MAGNKFNSLYRQIALVFFTMLTIIGVVFVLTTIYHSNQYFEEVNQRLNKKIAFDIAKSSVPFKEGKLNETELKKLFDHVMVLNPSLEIYLLDSKGNILTYYAPEKDIQMHTVNLKPVKEFLETKGESLLFGDDPRHPGIEKIFSAAPVNSDGKLNGYYYVVLSSTEYDNISKFLFGTYLFRVGLRTLAIIILSTLLIGLFLIWIITKNFSKLLVVTQKFRSGDLSARADFESTGDIKVLVETFNEMADILKGNLEKQKKMEELRRELMANVSHDLRTPISIINGYSETLEMKKDILSESEKSSYLKIIHESSKNLHKLVDELFELSKLESNQVHPNMEAFSIAELVNDIAAKYKLKTGQMKIEIETKIGRDLPMVFGDISLIDRVIQNLVDNALKFTPEGGKVTISTDNKKDSVEICVIDTGTGIRKEEVDKIFERHYSSDNSEFAKNTGLGLDIAKKILELHFSELELIHKENAGGCFLFKLPSYQK